MSIVENRMINSQTQLDWDGIYNNCAFSISGLSNLADIDEGSIRKYLKCERVPRKKNLLKMEKSMFEAQKKKKLDWHPSYGFATEDQIKELREVGLGPRHDQILKEIERQNENNGKYIF